MPLYREWNSDPYSLAAIWKIDEPEAYFVNGARISSDIKNPKRRIERLAGRFLLQYLERDFPLHDIMPDEHDKPRISGNRYYFSISHSFPYVAAVVSPYTECGIDIQCWHPRMLVLQHKFLSGAEQVICKADEKLITLAWCMKEAVYKWQGRRGVDFIEHLEMQELENMSFNYIKSNIILNNSAVPAVIPVNGFIYDDFALAVVENHIIQ